MNIANFNKGDKIRRLERPTLIFIYLGELSEGVFAVESITTGAVIYMYPYECLSRGWELVTEQNLEEQLQQAVATEDYETACVLRDRINFRGKK